MSTCTEQIYHEQRNSNFIHISSEIYCETACSLFDPGCCGKDCRYCAAQVVFQLIYFRNVILQRLNISLPYSEKDGEIDICQLVVNYVAEAGRFTDEAIPPSFFANRKKLSLKNSKITGLLRS